MIISGQEWLCFFWVWSIYLFFIFIFWDTTDLRQRRCCGCRLCCCLRLLLFLRSNQKSQQRLQVVYVDNGKNNARSQVYIIHMNALVVVDEGSKRRLLLLLLQNVCRVCNRAGSQSPQCRFHCFSSFGSPPQEIRMSPSSVGVRRSSSKKKIKKMMMMYPLYVNDQLCLIKVW